MTRMIALLLAVALVIAAAGCKQTTATQYAVNTTSAAASMVQLDQAIDPAIASIQQRWDLYTPEEQTRLKFLYAELSELRHTVKSMIGDAGGVGEFLIAASEVERFYTVAKANYIEARKIIAPHFDELSTSERMQVSNMDGLALRLDHSLEALLKAPDGTDISQTLGDLLAVAATVARVVAMH